MKKPGVKLPGIEEALSVLKELYDNGVELPPDQLEELYDNKIIERPVEKKEIILQPNQQLHVNDTSEDDKRREIAEIKDASARPTKQAKETDINTELYIEGNLVSKGFREPTKADWDVIKGDKFNLPETFCQWIDSINSGWRNKIYYEPFDIYCKQAEYWLRQGYNYADQYTEEDQESFMIDEIRRFKQNTLYYAAKYGKLREGDIEGGGRLIDPYECQKVAWYLQDMGLNIGLIKARQIGMTSAEMLYLAKKVQFTLSFFAKFVTEKDDKGIEIMEHKLKYPISRMPKWAEVNMHNDSDKKISFMLKTKKGDISGVNSAVVTEAPYVTVIAGGSPQLVMIDEAGNIPILVEMIQDGRPTMFFNDPITKKRTFKRQLIFWGCVCAGTKVWDNNGNLVNIENLKQEDGILGFNQESVKVSKEEITYWQPPSEKQCFRITTNTGRFLECSFDHPLFRRNRKFPKWKAYSKEVTKTRVYDLKIGDSIAIVREIPVFGNKKMFDARLVGNLIGDGTYGLTEWKYKRKNGTTVTGLSGGVTLINADNEIWQYVESKYSINPTQPAVPTQDGRMLRKDYIHGVAILLDEIGIRGQTKDRKRLPINIHSYTKEDVCEFIAGYFDTDGCVSANDITNNNLIKLSSANIEILKEMQLLLLKIGVNSNINYQKPRPNPKSTRGHYNLDIKAKTSILNFHKHIRLLVDKKRNALERIVKKIISRNTHTRREDDKFFFDRIVSIEDIGARPIYNLTAGTTHTYISNGFLSANTGGNMMKGGGALETEWKKIHKLFNERNFTMGIIPLFFDCFANPLFTEEDYNSEYEIAYSVIGIEAENSKIKFHQSYPRTFDDVFLRSPDTFIPMAEITKGLERIYRIPQDKRPVYGYMKEIYDQNQPNGPNADVPFKIVGADFIPLTDKDIHRATVQINEIPDPMWVNRYYQGLDPIDTTSGYSNFASAIYDASGNTFSALLNFRTDDYRYCYLQGLLLGIYYDKNIKNLIEINRGTGYKDFCISNGWRQTLLYNTMLPPHFQSPNSNEPYGLDNKGRRAEGIIHSMKEMYEDVGGNIVFDEYFIQMKTFVRSFNKKTGGATWGSYDARYYRDDVLYAMVMAYINATVPGHINKPPMEKGKANKKRARWRYEYTNGQMDLKRTMV